MTENEKALLEFVTGLDMNRVEELTGSHGNMRERLTQRLADLRRPILIERLPPGYREELKSALVAYRQANERLNRLREAHPWACQGDKGLIAQIFNEMGWSA